MTATVVRDPRFAEHDPGPHHPEAPARYRGIASALEAASGLDVVDLPARAATAEELARVHQAEHLERLDALRGRAAMIDPDTYTSETSVEIAYLGAGATIELATRVAEGRTPPGIALPRPPGHHAIPGRAMGFCLLNNVAAAAQALLDRGLAERVAIYDWDVHHGNGTQDIFYEDPRVLYMSTHQAPFYPGTGRASETGRGAGEGATVNLPLPAGTGDDELIRITREVLAPKVRDFSPDFILISAGYDAHLDDPVGELRVTDAGFVALTELWRELAEGSCPGRIAAVLEGGYDPAMLGRSVVGLLRAWGA